MRLPASFRDPSGFVFRQDGILYRQVNHSYQDEYDHLVQSGLYQKLVDAGLLIPHTESDHPRQSDEAYKILRPDEVRQLSYPYEWSFSQLKAAALATLRIQKIAFQHGMTLKDASAYNLQFVHGKPIFIDTLSFERYQAGNVWIAYRQFCSHFLAPLALMHYTDVRLNQLLRIFIDGIPLDLAAKLLPYRARLRLSLFIHIFLHARAQRRYQHKLLDSTTKSRKTTRQAFLGLLDNLESGIKKLHWQASSAWADYYTDNSYTSSAFAHKTELVTAFITAAKPESVWDLGANTGVFSRIASRQGIPTVAWDADPGAVEVNQQTVIKSHETNLLPLVLDLTNPSAALGWAQQERLSFAERAPVDMVMALALIHHLAISNNVPLTEIARFFSDLCQQLIIEFVPKGDPKVQKLLTMRRDIFPDYTSAGFEAAFALFFTIQHHESIHDSQRSLYFMTKRS